MRVSGRFAVLLGLLSAPNTFAEFTEKDHFYPDRDSVHLSLSSNPRRMPRFWDNPELRGKPVLFFDDRGLVQGDQLLCSWVKVGFKLTGCPAELPLRFLDVKHMGGTRMFLEIEDVDGSVARVKFGSRTLFAKIYIDVLSNIYPALRTEKERVARLWKDEAFRSFLEGISTCFGEDDVNCLRRYVDEIFVGQIFLSYSETQPDPQAKRRAIGQQLKKLQSTCPGIADTVNPISSRDFLECVRYYYYESMRAWACWKNLFKKAREHPMITVRTAGETGQEKGRKNYGGKYSVFLETQTNGCLAVAYKDPSGKWSIGEMKTTGD